MTPGCPATTGKPVPPPDWCTPGGSAWHQIEADWWKLGWSTERALAGTLAVLVILLLVHWARSRS